MAGLGMAQHGKAGLGGAGLNLARQGRHGKAGVDRQVTAQLVQVKRGYPGLGEVRHGRQGKLGRAIAPRLSLWRAARNHCQRRDASP